MTITEFANELIATLKTSFPDLFEHATFAVHTVPKPGNVLLTGITVSFHGSNITPCYYIDEQYNQWLNGMPVTAAASDLAEVIRKTNDIPCNIDVNFIRNFESARDHIFPRLIDTRPGRNSDYVADRVCNPVPGTSISVLYDVEISRDSHGTTTASTPVTNSLAELWNISLEELHEIAVRNAVAQRPLYFSDLYGVLNDMGPESFPYLEEEPMLYVLTNRDKMQGASAILYPEAAKMLQTRFPNGVWLLPSSIHEWIVVSKEISDDTASLKSMVTTINAVEVLPADQLSDNVYTLDADSRLTEVC